MTDDERLQKAAEAIATCGGWPGATTKHGNIYICARAAISAMEGETIPPALAAARFDQVSAGLMLAHLQALASFAREIIQQAWDASVDGGDVQDLASDYHLIVAEGEYQFTLSDWLKSIPEQGQADEG